MLDLFKVKREKFGLRNLLVMMIFGALLISTGLLILKDSQIDKNWVRVKGNVVSISPRTSDGSTTYTPIVQYTVGSNSYQITSRMSTSFQPKIGSEREVAYNPANPGEAKIIEGSLYNAMIIVLPLIGLFLIVFGIYQFIKSGKRERYINNLIQYGQKVQGVLTEVRSVGSNKSPLFQIVVSATDGSGTVRNYLSDRLTGMAQLVMIDFKSKPILIDVYVDPSNTENYYVDLSDIPELTPQRIQELINSAKSQY